MSSLGNSHNNSGDNWRRIQKRLDDRQMFANTAAFQTPGFSTTIVIRFQVIPTFLHSTLSPPPLLLCRKIGVTELSWIYDSRGVNWTDVGRDHIWKNVLLYIGLRDARCTRLIGVSSPLLLLCSSHTVCSLLNVSFAANDVSDSSRFREFITVACFVLSGYWAILLEPCKVQRCFTYHQV
jgi:hypothetical protein